METTTTKTATTKRHSEWLVRYMGEEIATATNSVVAHAAAQAQSLVVSGRVELWSGLVLAYVYQCGNVVGRYY